MAPPPAHDPDSISVELLFELSGHYIMPGKEEEYRNCLKLASGAIDFAKRGKLGMAGLAVSTAMKKYPQCANNGGDPLFYGLLKYVEREITAQENQK